MDRGRKICDVLKAVRKKIADMNGIAYEPRVCHFKGHCSGTCPACETERKYIESELSLRKRMGEAVCVTGVVNPAKRNVLDLKNEMCKNREKRNVLKISHTRHFKTQKSSPKRAAFIVFER